MATVVSSLALRLGFNLPAFQSNLAQTTAALNTWAATAGQPVQEVQQAVDNLSGSITGLDQALSDTLQVARRPFPTTLITQDDIELVRQYDGALQSLESTFRETRAQGALFAAQGIEPITGAISEAALQPTAPGGALRVTGAALQGMREAEEIIPGTRFFPGIRSAIGFIRGTLEGGLGELRTILRADEEQQRLRAEQQLGRRGRFDPVQYRRELRMMQLRTRGVRIIAR